jgi:predicted DCC family thiol-disulfide oxidoreductase YuxK
MVPAPIVYYDGVCGLCNRAVAFIIRHDREGKIHFATLQSTEGEKASAAVLRQSGKTTDSVIFEECGKYYTGSDAVVHIAAWLDGPWKWLRFLKVVPRFIREGLYRFVSRHRYRWFGKRDTCELPAPELRSRFIN